MANLEDMSSKAWTFSAKSRVNRYVPRILAGPFQNPSNSLTHSKHVSSIRRNGSHHRGDSRTGRGNVLAGKVGQEGGGGVAHGSAGAKDVDLARAAEARRAGRAARREHLAGEAAGLDLDGDVLEDVALGQDVGAAADLEGVAGGGVVVPVVVDGVKKGVAADLGRAAGEVVNVVVFEGDGVLKVGGQRFVYQRNRVQREREGELDSRKTQ